MQSLSDEELANLISAGESERVEFKQSLRGNAPQGIREAICAFANDLAGNRLPGIVAVGVSDDGTPSNLPIDDALLRQLADMRSDGNIVPPPSMLVEKRLLSDVEIAVVTVDPSDSPPVRFDGRIHVRIGPRRHIATAQDERILNERRRFKDRPFDVQPVPTAKVADLDLALFTTQYLRQAVAPDVLETNDRSETERLASTKMIASASDPTPTVLGLLLIGTRVRDFLPGAYTQFLRIAGHELSGPIIDEAVIDGTIVDIIRNIEAKLDSHNRRSVSFTESPTERRSETYPAVALQQLVRNAIMHRTYEATHAPVRVTWFDDRFEILSPGGPFGAVNAANFGGPGITDYRNPNLAEAMRVLGYVQRFGAGIAIARRALREHGLPEPIFEPTPEFVLVTIMAAQK
ncbi:MAG: putative DNA binding domain-containing protein [Acetobacteraceae bacterium]|nr:putative DNA binding domain-containing protein [Acetobacteraceae bacterium]